MTIMLKSAPSASNTLYALTPAQRRTFERALATIAGAGVTVLKGDVGSGKSLIVKHLQSRVGGTAYSLQHILGDIAKRGGSNIEETLLEFLDRAFRLDSLVFIEDITMLDLLGREAIVDRPFYLHHVLSAFYDRLIASGSRLVVVTSDRLNRNNETKGALVEVEDFDSADLRVIIENHATTSPANFDVDKVWRAHRNLTGHQIVAAMGLLQTDGAHLDADAFITAADKVKSRSNFVVEDVEDVTLEGLIGIDHIVRELMRTIIIPMTQHGLARQLGLKPARGVLLHGEPGTGKTTIGRALARQMRGKFFLMDGSTPPGGKQDALLAAAEASLPSVFFIDDADVIFRNGENSGFARKLLTKLDGLESESISNVCIMMTAMDIADMPPALVRSGRVDVWLHMDLPDDRTRADIIRHYSRTLPSDLRVFDDAKIIAATEGFVPADLRGLVGDARGHIAYDRHKGRPRKSFEDYLLLAAEEIGARKLMLTKLAGKPQPKPVRPKVLAPPPCTDGKCG